MAMICNDGISDISIYIPYPPALRFTCAGAPKRLESVLPVGAAWAGAGRKRVIHDDPSMRMIKHEYIWGYM